MDGAAAVVSEKNSQIPLGDAKTAQLMERLERLLQEAAIATPPKLAVLPAPRLRAFS
jgi:hypothetical protein